MSAQPSPKPSPSLGVGLAKALPKAFSYSAQRFFLLDSDVPFSSPAQHSPASPPKPDLARVRPPCRGGSGLPKRAAQSPQPPRLAAAQASPTQARSAQPSSPQPGPSLGAGLAERFAKAFLTGFRGPIFGRETAPFLVRFWPVWGRRAAAFDCFGGSMFGAFLARQSAAQPSQARQPSPAQPSPAHSPAQPSTAQLVHPSLGVGLAKALPKAFSYRNLARVRPPCRCVSLFSPRPGQPSPGQVSPAQPTAARPKPWCGPCRTLCKGFSYRIQRSHFRPRDGSVFGVFLARLGPPCRCVWLFWRVHVWCVLGAPKCRPAEPSTPGYATAQPRLSRVQPCCGPQPSPAHTQPAQSRPGQPKPCRSSV